MYLSKYLKAYPSRSKPDQILLYSTVRGSTALVPADLYLSALRGELSEAEQQTLKKLGMMVDDLEEERDFMRDALERMNQRSRRFDAMIILNLDCNLDCVYCYEGNFRAAQYMSPETARLVVDRLRERMVAGMDVAASFYGGEPLLSEDLIREISLPLLETAQQNNVSFTFSLVTNGTLLTRETALRLLPLGLKAAKFTLDGPPEIHDRQRPYASGSGSFDTILDNLAEICDLVAIQLSGNFYREEYRLFPKVLDLMVERGIAPEKIKQVQFAPVLPKAGCAEYSSGCACTSDPWLMEAATYLREETMRRGFPASKLSVSACMVELNNNLVVNYDGTLYKCPGFMGWEGFCIGTLADGSADYSESHALRNWQNETCLDCAYLPICFGGCRFLKLLQGKGVAEVDCRQAFWDATLETMLIQNMKYAQPPVPSRPVGD